jgi:hypothetical protein
VLDADVWAKWVVSPARIENFSQLIMAPGLFVTVSTLPAWVNAAVPLTTLGFNGFGCAGDAIKQAATAATHRRTGVARRRRVEEDFLSSMMLTPWGVIRPLISFAFSAIALALPGHMSRQQNFDGLVQKPYIRAK